MRAAARSLLVVSIHAPARGATQRDGLGIRFRAVSIHAPARGATYTQKLAEDAQKFQSTRPRGARPLSPRSSQPSGMVSIHAPARGATLSSALPSRPRGRFNPRAREGRDPRRSSPPTPPPRFNPRAREGRDTPDNNQERRPPCFNPRAREGRDRRRSRTRRPTRSFNPRAREGRDALSIRLRASPLSSDAIIKLQRLSKGSMCTRNST